MTPPDNIPYRKLFPWLHLFRAIGIAMSPRQLLVAGIAIFALWIGQEILELVTSPTIIIETRASSLSARIALHPTVDLELSLGGFSELTSPGHLLALLSGPMNDVVRPALEACDPRYDLAERWKALSHCLWALMVWSLFGLALCRLAANRFACDDGGSFRRASQFAISRWKHAVLSPLIPVGAALIVTALAAAISLPGRISWLGSTWISLVGPMVLGCGLVAAFLLIAVVLGWPLMVAAIACDDCDGFGGLSRSYSLWTGRPWQFSWFVIVAAVAGVFGSFLATLLANCTLSVALSAITLGRNDGPFMSSAEVTYVRWLKGVVAAYGISFFWTSATIVYALLRHSVDGVPLHLMAPDDEDRPPRDPLPVVGMPAMNPPEQTEPPPTSATQPSAE